MNVSNNGQGRIYLDGWYDTSVFLNENGFAEFSIILSSINMVGLEKDLQSQFVAIGLGAAAMYFLNVIIIVQVKKKHLVEG